MQIGQAQRQGVGVKDAGAAGAWGPARVLQILVIIVDGAPAWCRGHLQPGTAMLAKGAGVGPQHFNAPGCQACGRNALGLLARQLPPGACFALGAGMQGQQTLQKGVADGDGVAVGGRARARRLHQRHVRHVAHGLPARGFHAQQAQQ
ncbi:hypothetical protein D3C73_1217630 [compost metagenome]